jgi:hypothetical protein
MVLFAFEDNEKGKPTINLWASPSMFYFSSMKKTALPIQQEFIGFSFV